MGHHNKWQKRLVVSSICIVNDMPSNAFEIFLHSIQHTLCNFIPHTFIYKQLQLTQQFLITSSLYLNGCKPALLSLSKERNDGTTLRTTRNAKQGQATGQKGSGESRVRRRGGGAGERHSELTKALVVAGFHHCSVACRRTAAAPGPYDLFQICTSQHH